MRTLLDLPIDEALERFFIDRSVTEWRDESDQRAFKHFNLLDRPFRVASLTKIAPNRLSEQIVPGYRMSAPDSNCANR
jgi:hypothetical protein